MEQIKLWFQKNKVVFTGMVAAISVALYQFVGATVTDYWVVAYAAFVAGVGFLANNLRGQWMTVATLALTAGASIYKAHQAGGHVDVFQLILLGVLGFLGVAAPPPKSREYEHSPTIVEAKQEAAVIIEEKKEAKAEAKAEAKELKDNPPINYTQPKN